MKKLSILMLPIVAMATNLVAFYEYDLANLVNETLVVKINQKRVDNKDYYQIIKPGNTVKQVFDNAFCLEKLSWALWDKNAPLNGGMDLVDKTTGRIPEENQRAFGDKVAGSYAFLAMEMIMQPNEVFKQTRKAAADLLKGIDSLACQTIDSAKVISQMAGGIPGVPGQGGSGAGAGTGAGTGGSTGSSMTGGSTGNVNFNFGPIGGPGSGMGGGTGGGAAAPAKPCSFGLGKIASASGKLAGYTLCKSREFIIYFKTITDATTGEEKPVIKYGRPVLTATTVEGQ